MQQNYKLNIINNAIKLMVQQNYKSNIINNATK